MTVTAQDLERIRLQIQLQNSEIELREKQLEARRRRAVAERRLVDSVIGHIYDLRNPSLTLPWLQQWISAHCEQAKHDDAMLELELAKLKSLAAMNQAVLDEASKNVLIPQGRM